MVVRGAPAIGITAAYGLAMAQRAGAGLAEAAALLAASRPTAVNLKWALDRVRTPDPGTGAVTCCWLQVAGAEDMEAAAALLHEEDILLNKRLGEAGAGLLGGGGGGGGGVLTICNTGALATGGHGTALGMVSN